MQTGLIFKRILAVLSLLSMSVTVAHAGGGDQPQRPYSWTGAYIGLTAGYAWGETRFNDGLPPDQFISNPFDIDGGAVGGTAGYNFQLRSGFVVGVEADLSYSNISGSFRAINLG